uniref:Putative hydroxypyruvate isomerase n=1 Tax=Plectus sambesii TaxID=2011161 RepID=A0A914VS86_9BILA
MRVAANLNMLFQEAGGLLQRYEAAAAAGFKYVEVSLPYGEDAEKLKEVKERLNLEQVLINSPPGNWDEGERGLACLPEKRDEFRKSIDVAIRYAKALNCSRVHVMAGMAPDDYLRVQSEKVFVENIAYAAERLAAEGITCLLEPINPKTMPGYFLFSYDQALGYLQQIKQPNLKIQLDIFHAYQICGSLTKAVKDLFPEIGHVQVAQVPERHEPDSAGEVDYKDVFKWLLEEGYDGYIGAEYIPEKSTTAGLGWIDKFGLCM